MAGNRRGDNSQFTIDMIIAEIEGWKPLWCVFLPELFHHHALKSKSFPVHKVSRDVGGAYKFEDIISQKPGLFDCRFGKPINGIDFKNKSEILRPQLALSNCQLLSVDGYESPVWPHRNMTGNVASTVGSITNTSRYVLKFE
ncbi:conserved hypothetical protein [Coccidioides posadasii str. Silveira]|uniref:Uncharacterized protein n=1 Tax=Coccidioides posadasii (strain RMSCC 757 / Silveira) TaxID=443226 RepID=E9D949_COCPS|nr:conserved hypothetical protein [Coccidioides posadasii str. Silveira]